MRVRAPPQLPEELAVVRLDRQIIDAGIATAHQALLGELPVFIAVAAIPVARVVVPLIGKAHRDTRAGTSPQLLDEAVVELARPLSTKELANLLAADGELGAVAPLRVFGIDLHHAIGVARIPGVFGHA